MASKLVRCIVVAGVTLLLAGCNDYKSRYGDSDFEWGFTTGSAEMFKETLVSYYHMAETDSDCVVSTIVRPRLEPDGTFGGPYTITADLLDAATEECDVDTSTIWHSWD